MCVVMRHGVTLPAERTLAYIVAFAALLFDREGDTGMVFSRSLIVVSSRDVPNESGVVPGVEKGFIPG